MTKKRSSGETIISSTSDDGSGGGHEILVNDTPFDQQPALNFLDGAGITFAGTDDVANTETELVAAMDIAPLPNKAVPHPNDMIPIADSEDGDSIAHITVEDLAIVAAGGTTKTRLTGEIIYYELLAGTGLFDTGTLPTGYAFFEVHLRMRCSPSATNDTVYLRFNGDTTAGNYRNALSGSSSGSASNGVVNNPRISISPAATSPSGSFGVTKIRIPDPEGTVKLKVSYAEDAAQLDATTGQVVYGHQHLWNSVSAITSIQVVPDGAPTDTFVAGSEITVIGYREEGIGGGITQFTELLDVPSSYSGQAGSYPRVKQDESGLEFFSGVSGGKLRHVGTVLHDEILGSDGTFDVSSISQDYDDLEVILEGRSTVNSSGGVQNVNMSLNNDTTDANYALASPGVGNSNQRLAHVVVGNDATAGRVGQGVFWIRDYTSAFFKKMDGWYFSNNTTAATGQRSLEWRNTAAVNRVTIAVANATTTFVAGTRLRIIGWRTEQVGGVEVSDGNISATPTDAEVDAIFGTPASVGDGFNAIIDDGGAGTNVWKVYAKNNKWWGEQLTELT